jgi:flagellar motor switch protein FliN/FliY
MADQTIKDDVGQSPASNQTTQAADPQPAGGARPLGQAEPSAAGVTHAVAGGADPKLELADFAAGVLEPSGQPIDLLGDVELNVKVELGRCRMAVEDVLRLAEGSVVELDKLAGDPVDVLVNDRLVAHGEVLVLNDTFCIRVNEIVSEDRLN